MKTEVKKNIKKIVKPAIVRETYRIDATGKILGRLAVEISLKLRGKNKPNYQHHIDSGSLVFITNVAKIKVSGKKAEQKEYYHYSGYPGGLKTKKFSREMEKNPSNILRMAVWNMLPKNKLRAIMIRRLKISN